jgi:hypothetical protein
LSEESPASAQNREPPQARLSGSGERGEEGSSGGKIGVAAESPFAGKGAELTVIFLYHQFSHNSLRGK